MRTLLTKARASPFIRHNAVYFAGSMAVAFLNYLYHPILSRMLSLQDFGEVQTIFSLTVQISIILGVIGLVAVNIESNKESAPQRQALLRDIQAATFWTMVVVSLGLLIFSPELAALFHFNSLLPFFILVAILLSNLPITFRRANLQAQYDFTGISVAGLVMAAGRLVAAIALIIIGWRVAGALAGLAIAQVLAGFYLLYKTRNIKAGLRWQLQFSRPLLREMGYILLTLLATGFVAFLTSADILFAKFYFDPTTAGSYSGISTLARIIFFATTSIAAVLLPSIKLHHSFSEHARLFGKSMLLLLAIGLGALLVFYFFPTTVITILIGPKFLPSADLLARLSLVTFFASIVNLFVFYFLALRHYAVLFVVAAGAAATVVPILALHRTPLDIVNGFLIGSCMTVAFFMLLFIHVWYRSKRAS
jgi:O-antigen/teichoic acid export membrane protein